MKTFDMVKNTLLLTNIRKYYLQISSPSFYKLDF